MSRPENVVKAEALREAADAIQALHPGEVKNSVTFLRDRADRLAADAAAPEGEVHRLAHWHPHALVSLCSCGRWFERDEWKAHQSAAPVAVEGVETVEWVTERVEAALDAVDTRRLPADGTRAWDYARQIVSAALDPVSPVEPETSEPEGGDRDA